MVKAAWMSRNVNRWLQDGSKCRKHSRSAQGMAPILLATFLLAAPAFGGEFFVSTSGDNNNPGTAEQPWRTIQFAVDQVGAGDTVSVLNGVYNELVQIRRSGSADAGYFVLRNAPGQAPVIDGTGLETGAGDGMPALIKIISSNYIKIIGFELRNLITDNTGIFPAGIWVRGSGHHLEIRDNRVHHIEHRRGGSAGAHGIAIYGTNSRAAIHDLILDGNEVRDCILGWSEALVLNGNVRNFIVSNNSVHDCDNIGLDFIGFEGVCSGCSGDFGDNVDRARDGVVVGNVVYNIDTITNPAYGGERSAGGIYVDGGANIIIERNTVYGCNLGVELASEHYGKATEGIVLRNNFIYHNLVLGIATGGYSAGTGAGGGEAKNNFIVNNSLYQNTTSERPQDDWGGEFLLQNRNINNVYKNNIVYARAGRARVNLAGSLNSGNNWGHQLYFGSTAGEAPGQVISADPRLVDPANGDLRLLEGSPAIDAGETLDSTAVGTVDFDGNPRVQNGAIDIGAHEFSPGTSVGWQLSTPDAGIPREVRLYPNYPNPFNPSTRVRFALPRSAHVELAVYNLQGQQVARLLDAMRGPGEFETQWTARNPSGQLLAAGIYLLRLRTGDVEQSRRVVLVK